MKKAKKQRFHVRHQRAKDFEMGLRSYASYRDLGLDKKTSGMVQAHVIRLRPPFDPKVVSKWHYHDVELQFVYVLKGWIRSEFKGHGAHTMKRGTCWLQPPKIRHRVLGYSRDCELLEVVLPAKFGTVELD